MPRQRKNPTHDFRSLEEVESDIKILRSALEQVEDATEGVRIRTQLAHEYNVLNDLERRQEALTELANTQPTPAEERIGSFAPVLRERDSADEGPFGGVARSAALQLLDRRVAAGMDDRAATELESLVRADPMGRFSAQLLSVADSDYNGPSGWFAQVLRHGTMVSAHLTPDNIAARERVVAIERAMNIGTGSAGGFLLPFSLDPTIQLSSNGAVSPIRQIARNEKVSTNEWRAVTSAGGTAVYVAEATQATDNSPVLAQPVVQCDRAQYFVPFSIEQGQDWNQLTNELSKVLSDAKDVLEADKFLTGAGHGSNEPSGLLTGASIGGTTVGGTLLASDVYSILEALPPRFRPNATWVSDLSTKNKLAQMETSNGARLFPSVDSDRLLSKPYLEWSSMSGVSTGGSVIAVVGDFSNYVIVDRVGVQAQIIPHLFGGTASTHYPTGQSGFYALWRNSGTVLVANAFRTLKLHT